MVQRLNFYQLFLHHTNLQNLGSPHHLFVGQHLSVILLHLSVTLHTASKWNYKHNKQKCGGLVINKLS